MTTAVAVATKPFLTAEHTTANPKYPNCIAVLNDGNVFSVIGAVSGALRRGGVPREDIRTFETTAFQAEGYHEALSLCMRTCRCTRR